MIHILNKLRLPLIAIALIGGATVAQAQGLVIDAADFCDGSPRGVADDIVTNVATGDTFTFEGGDNVSLFINQVFVYDLKRWIPQSYTITAAQDGSDAEFRADGFADISCVRNPAPVMPNEPSNGNTAAQQQSALNSAAQTSVTVQASATENAITNNLSGRFGGAGFAASESNIFVSTRGLGRDPLDEPQLNAWLALDGRIFSGTTTGRSTNLTFGLDRLISPTVVLGGFLGVNSQSVTTNGLDTDTNAPLLGIYAAQKRDQNLYFSGFLAYGTPTYTTGTNRFRTQRYILGFSLDSAFDAGRLTLSPSATVLASRENLPKTTGTAADTLINLQAKIGLRAALTERLSNGMLPWINLAAEYREQGSDLQGRDTFLRPRLGLGLDWQLAAGSLNWQVDFGAVNSGTDDRGMSLVYNFKF